MTSILFAVPLMLRNEKQNGRQAEGGDHKPGYFRPEEHKFHTVSTENRNGYIFPLQRGCYTRSTGNINSTQSGLRMEIVTYLPRTGVVATYWTAEMRKQSPLLRDAPQYQTKIDSYQSQTLFFILGSAKLGFATSNHRSIALFRTSEKGKNCVAYQNGRKAIARA